MYLNIDGKRLYITETVIVGQEMFDKFWQTQRERQRKNLEPLSENRDNHLLLLTVNENTNEGIITDFSTGGEKYAPILSADIKVQVHDQIREIADYCIKQGIANNENGAWMFAYYELNNKFNVNISQQNGLGRLLLARLQQADEINELIMTEDCIEMTYHLEYCQNCRQDGVDGAISLLSLLGCNLSDVHLIHDEEEHETATVVELNKNTLTDEGKQDWADVLNGTVTSIYEGPYGTQIGIKGCSATRLGQFAYMLAGHCPSADYDRWVNSGEEQAESPNKQGYHEITQTEFDIALAKHTLWFNDQDGGEQAVFSNCIFKELNLTHRNMLNTVFENCEFIGTDFTDSELCFSTMNCCRFIGCDFSGVTAEECDFKQAVFEESVLNKGVFTHSNFTGSNFRDCEMYGGSLQNCCMEDVINTDFTKRQVNTSGISYDEAEWLSEDEQQGSTMSM